MDIVDFVIAQHSSPLYILMPLFKKWGDYEESYS